MSRRIYGGDCLADSSDQETQKNPRHFYCVHDTKSLAFDFTFSRENVVLPFEMLP